MQTDAKKKCEDFSLPDKNIECRAFEDGSSGRGALFVFRSDITTINFRLTYRHHSERKCCVYTKITHPHLSSPMEKWFEEPRVFPHKEERYKDEELRLRIDNETTDGYRYLVKLMEICLNIIRVNRNELLIPMVQ